MTTHHFLQMKNELETFVLKFMSDNTGTRNPRIEEEFRNGVTALCDSISRLDIKFSDIHSGHTCKILKCLCDVMAVFYNTDVRESLSNVDYVLCLRFCQLVIKYKALFMTEALIEGTNNCLNISFLLKYETEQCLVNAYKSNLNRFRAECNEKEVEQVEEEFSRFLLIYVRILTRLNFKERLHQNLNLLLEVAAVNVLVKNIHFISHAIRVTTKFSVWESITKFCIEKNVSLENSMFSDSMDIDFKFEAYIMTYYTLRHICECIDFQSLQTSQILSVLTIEEIIRFIETGDGISNKEFDKKYEQLVKFINFKTCKKIRTVSSPNILKCVNVLQFLLNSFKGREFHNCPFPVVIFSLLYELVMITDVDRETILSLINLAIDYLEICKLPSNFMAVSYVFKIYQKLKSDNDLKIKSKLLCRSMAVSFKTHEINRNLIDDLESVINTEENWVDKCIITSYFLSCLEETSNMKDATLNKMFCVLNEQVIHLFHEDKSLGSLLIFPYSVSLKFSILNKNGDYLLHNLAVFSDYLTIFFDEDEDSPLDDKTYFILTVLQHYRDVVGCLPKNFSITCCKYILRPRTMNIDVLKSLFKVITPDDFTIFMNMLEIQTVTVIQERNESQDERFNSYLHQIWSYVINMQLENPWKKIRKNAVNHCCFVIDKTFLFRPKIIQTDQGLKLLLKLMCLLLKVPWINKTLLINSSLRILTFVGKSSVISDVHVYTEAAELLIVLYKYPDNAIIPFLGLFVASFAQLFGNYWTFIKSNTGNGQKQYDKDLIIPLHKFEKCSSLFSQNRIHFRVICRYFLQNMSEKFVFNDPLPNSFMKMCDKIIFNLISLCSVDEMKQLLSNIKEPAFSMLNNLYNEYKFLIR